MGYIRGEGRRQGTLFPVVPGDLIPADHVCRVIDALVDRLAMAELGFVDAEPEETGRPGYDPRDLLKLYLYGYPQQMRSSRRLEAEFRRNVEPMRLLGRLQPAFISRSPSSGACIGKPSRKPERNWFAWRGSLFTTRRPTRSVARRVRDCGENS